MKNFILSIIDEIKLKRKLKRQIENLTYEMPCVNLSLKYMPFSRIYFFYNNSDLIASFTYRELTDIVKYGMRFFDLIIYCLCVKNSIDNYY